ncbi:hypothetical protein C8Q78DRAFT_1082897 [Trametes maxima]|nr:hypothetical protein C8Q78DRAFT_1082897 [Trametes maxima]
MDPSLYKDVEVSRGFTYNYHHSPAAPGKPTVPLLHGFPSCSLGRDWQADGRHADAFRLALIARDVADVLDAEGLSKVLVAGGGFGGVVPPGGAVD